MGELNVESFHAAAGAEEEHRAQHELELESVRNATPDDLLDAWRTILGAPDVEVLTRGFAEFALDSIRAGIEPSSDGWFDDDLVFVKPWGFELASIRVPVLVWQGEQDLMVPFAHGRWLAGNVPGAESRLTWEDGHLTILERHVGDLHALVVERFND